MHNGQIGKFSLLKKTLMKNIKSNLFSLIQGNTDTEHIYIMLLNNLPNIDKQLEPKVLLHAFKVK